MSDVEKDSIIKEKKYMLEYYASNTLHFMPDYIGEHIILLALDIVKENATLKDEIFALLNCEDGIKNKSSLKYRILNYPAPSDNSIENTIEVVQTFDNFNIALYNGLNDTSFENTIAQSQATYVELQSKYFDIPLNSPKLSYLMAGTVLLEAKDNNADFLIVNSKEDLSLFDAKQESIEKIMGREIAMPIITQEEFLKLISGEKNTSVLGIKSHKIKIPFLD